jgi:hypothetical protein
VALNAALETFTLGDSGHVDDLALFEQVNLEFRAELYFLDRVETKFPGAASRFDSSLFVVSSWARLR